MKNNLKYDEREDILYINLNSKEFYVAEPECNWRKEEKF